jgi:mannose/fructose/N-acetylgalactosamine-specific phosphotransferase system component IIC
VGTFQALLIALWAGIAGVDHRLLGNPRLNRPLVISPVVGLIMGDLRTGLITGAAMELIWMGAIRIGGSVPPNIVIGSVLGTVTAILTGQGAEAAVVVGAAAATLGSALEVFAKTICSFFIHQADAYAEKGDTKGITLMAMLGNLLYFLLAAVPVFLALAFGAEAVQNAFKAIPPALLNALKVTGKVLPAVGFGILLNMLWNQKLLVFFFVGFALAAFLKMPILAVAIIGVAIASVLVNPLTASDAEA